VHAFDCTGQGYIHHVHVVHKLHAAFFRISISKTAFLHARNKIYRINSVQNPVCPDAFRIKPAPAHSVLVDRHLVRKREYHMRKLETLGLVDSHDPHCRRVFWRAYLQPGLLPIF